VVSVFTLPLIAIRPRQFLEQIRVLNRRRNLIVARGPFAEIDAPAAVRAEREVLILLKDKCAARRAAQRLFGSACHVLNDKAARAANSSGQRRAVDELLF